MTLQTHILDGGNALSAFRTQQLLPKLQALCPDITELQGQFLHLVAYESALSSEHGNVLKQLLNYGDPAHGSLSSSQTLQLIVCPRLGTVSPWASKATDIAHNCGLPVRRIERLVEYTLGFKSTSKRNALTTEVKLQLADLLHDRIQDVLYGGLASDHKSQLQELSARRFGQLPRYVLTEEGPEHEKHFSAQVELDGEPWGTGEGRTKKEAEQAAAEQAFDRLKNTDSLDSDKPNSAQSNSAQPDLGSLAVSDRQGASPIPTETTTGGTHA